MDASQLSKISADAHVDEPHDLWFERMDPSLRDRAPRRIQAEQEGGWSLVVDDDAVGWMNLSADEAAAKEAARVAAVSPDVRLEMMRTDDGQRRDHLPHHRSVRVEHRRRRRRARRRASSTTTGCSSASRASSGSGSRR